MESASPGIADATSQSRSGSPLKNGPRVRDFRLAVEAEKAGAPAPASLPILNMTVNPSGVDILENSHV